MARERTLSRLSGVLLLVGGSSPSPRVLLCNRPVAGDLQRIVMATMLVAMAAPVTAVRIVARRLAVPLVADE